MTTELIGTPEKGPILRADKSAAGTLSQANIRYATIAIALALAYYHLQYEGALYTLVFASSITTALVLALTFLSRRMLFSITLIGLMVFTIVVAASVKHHYLEMVLHAYDVVFYMTSWSTIVFLWSSQKVMLLALVGMLALSVVAGIVLWRADTSRVPRRISAVLFILCIAAAAWANNGKGERKNTLFYWDNLYLSSFYASWSETAETLWKGQLLDAARSQSMPPFSIAGCELTEKPPHIILIHQESAVPPSFFPQIDYDHALDPFFLSFDGQLHKLRVETYGGASWLTEFSVLAGVSTYSFGGMRTFVQSLMQGKIHDAVPQVLARCGYKNSVFYPVPQAFVSNGRFYSTVGMPQIFDYRAQGAKRFNERDQFYYNNALNDIGRNLAESNSPIFTFVITSATHLPYNNTFEPNMQVSGGGPGTDPEMHEYLRRLSLAHMDYDEFRANLEKRFPNERFLIVQYGDHQPVATRTLLGFDETAYAEDIKLTPDSPGMLTYYSINGVNYDPPPMPAIDTLEVPYLGTVMLRAARIPLPEAYQERLRLMELCQGRYFTCSKSQSILSFHRRLMDSGLIEAR
ncbi:sulfatase [Hyphomicrobium methylovorum]|uniref:sulfatase-like hydrolase/transferase n=1 Tax=Hyphomicrobium methylovorum TaxID=84 RepID=UPI0015E71886|nr:sulfatase-like hydrolase/transferase [Hyphomicrobium methylovorum]MBA2125612.1 sulfatase [Hyphomicrobium methylovorum]